MRLNLVLLVLLAVSIAANLLVRRDVARPNVEYMPEMVQSKAYESYSPNPNLTDGKTMQPPVPGTIPRGFRPVHYRPAPEDALRAGEELKNPFEGRPDPRERGSLVYRSFCVPCHGPAGKGDGAVVLRGYPAPPSLLAEKTVNMKDGQMFHILTYGQKNMPSYATQVPPEDRWRVIAYIRSMQRSAKP